MRKNSYLLIFLFILILCALSIWAEDYLKMIGSNWHPRVVEKDKVSLTKNQKYSCQVKAYGWKALSKRRDKLGIFGDLYIKWGWKIVVHNPTKALIEIKVKFELKSDEGFVLDRAYFGDYQDSGVVHLYEGVKIWIKPGETELFQGVATYNQSAHKGEGSPSGLDWRIRCSKVD